MKLALRYMALFELGLALMVSPPLETLFASGWGSDRLSEWGSAVLLFNGYAVAVAGGVALITWLLTFVFRRFGVRAAAIAPAVAWLALGTFLFWFQPLARTLFVGMGIQIVGAMRWMQLPGWTYLLVCISLAMAAFWKDRWSRSPHVGATLLLVPFLFAAFVVTATPPLVSSSSLVVME